MYLFSNKSRYDYDIIDYDVLENLIKCGKYNITVRIDKIKDDKKVSLFFDTFLNTAINNIRNKTIDVPNVANKYHYIYNHDMNQWENVKRDKIYNLKDILNKHFDIENILSQIKNSLPAVVPSVDRYSEPNKMHISNIEALSNDVVIDVDGLDLNEAEAFKRPLFSNMPFIKMIFKSPSGKGLKIICNYESSFDMSVLPNKKEIRDLVWTDLYEQLVKTINDNPYGIEIFLDYQATDINRLCYLSYDKDVLYNKNTDPFLFEYVNYNGSDFDDLFDLEKEMARNRTIIRKIPQGDISTKIESVRSFYNYLRENNIRPFDDHEYRQVYTLGFGLVDMVEHRYEYREVIYQLFRDILLLDPYYGNHKGEGESFINSRFDNYWSSYDSVQGNKITYGSIVYFMNEKRYKK